MTETASMINREIRCRCGQVGVISGVEGAEDAPELVWVTHLVRLAMQTHIHRKAQMRALLAQLSRWVRGSVTRPYDGFVRQLAHRTGGLGITPHCIRCSSQSR